MTENELAGIIVDASYQVHKSLGPGLLESVYEAVLARELEERRVRVQRQIPVPVIWKDMRLEEGFRADLIAENLIIVEIKSLEKTAPVHAKQLLTYLRLTGLRLGLLINFGDEVIRNGIKRVVNGLPDEVRLPRP